MRSAAWCPDESDCPAACYFYSGYMGLMRQKPKNGPVAVLDLASGGIDRARAHADDGHPRDALPARRDAPSPSARLRRGVRP